MMDPREDGIPHIIALPAQRASTRRQKSCAWPWLLAQWSITDSWSWLEETCGGPLEQAHVGAARALRAAVMKPVAPCLPAGTFRPRAQ